MRSFRVDTSRLAMHVHESGHQDGGAGEADEGQGGARGALIQSFGTDSHVFPIT